jgi:hypothetical protein
MVADSGLRSAAVATTAHDVNIPVLVLLGFAAWTLTILVGSIGFYR